MTNRYLGTARRPGPLNKNASRNVTLIIITLSVSPRIISQRHDLINSTMNGRRQSKKVRPLKMLGPRLLEREELQYQLQLKLKPTNHQPQRSLTNILSRQVVAAKHLELSIMLRHRKLLKISRRTIRRESAPDGRRSRRDRIPCSMVRRDQEDVKAFEQKKARNIHDE